LSKDQVEHPVRKRGRRISKSANLDWENLSRVDLRDDTERGIEE
jgi:hypothetical protein